MEELKIPENLIRRVDWANGIFENDGDLVPGPISIENSLIPPEAGKYSIRLPYPDAMNPDRLADIKVLVWTCMDVRFVRSWYDFLQNVFYGMYTPENILVVSYAAGPHQQPKQRREGAKIQFEYLHRLLSQQVERVITAAHVGGCGGLKHFCGGKTITEAVPQHIQNIVAAEMSEPDPETAMTKALFPYATALLPKPWWDITQSYVLSPDFNPRDFGEGYKRVNHTIPPPGLIPGTVGRMLTLDDLRHARIK